ncbi:MAG: LarC family nickel insertion protein, partial [Desulfovibrionaceae bacterium]|nr:LarC family nickel insertion protein [Desulfovibrionaceae bacterium]
PHDHPHEHAHARGQAHDHGLEQAHEHAHEHGHTEAGPVLTVRPTSGLSGDIMVAGLASLAGLDSAGLNEFLKELRVPALENCLALETRLVNRIAGAGLAIELPHEHAHRTLADILGIVEASAMPPRAKEYAARAFTLLAEAEGAVHGVPPEEVHFHEVGALDSLLDTCLVCRLFDLIGPSHFVCGPLPLADGGIACAHGIVPSPAPAVLRLLQGVPVRGFAGGGETVTPTAISLLKALGAEFGGWPAMVVEKTAISYGTKVFADAPNGAVWALGRAWN